MIMHKSLRVLFVFTIFAALYEKYMINLIII